MPRSTTKTSADYRYYDLRRPDCRAICGSGIGAAKQRAITWIQLGYIEIETPILSRVRPKGARLSGASRLQPGKFYALRRRRS